jgi:hypothetical protein
LEDPEFKLRHLHLMQGNSWMGDSRSQEDTASLAGKLLDGGFERSRGYSTPFNSWMEDSRGQEDTASHAGKLLDGGFKRSRGYSIPSREIPGWRTREVKRLVKLLDEGFRGSGNS